MSDRNVTDDRDAAQTEEGVLLPPVDVVEDAAGITLYADLPGVPKDKLQVRVEADTLFIEGDISLPFVSDLRASYVEVPHPRYRRAFTLGQELDREKVAAEFKNGVLRLHVPKVEHVKPRRIEVEVG